MTSAPRSVAVLIIGVSLSLFVGLVYAAAAARTKPVEALVARITQTLSSTPSEPPDPWHADYRSLLPATQQELALRGSTWRVQTRDGQCELLKASEKTWSLVTSIVYSYCDIGGGSIDGRYLTLGRVEQGLCLGDQGCVEEQGSDWMLYDDRPRIIRAVPRPVPEGSWMVIDPVRNMGLYQGRIRSTLTPVVATRYWLVDEAGAALWSGEVTSIDPEARALIPLRMLSRSDGSLLLAYRRQAEGGAWTQAMAVLRPYRLQEGWRSVTLPTPLNGHIWRLDTWSQASTRSEAMLQYREGERVTTTRVRIP